MRSIPQKTFLRARAELRPFYFPGVLLKTACQPAPVFFRLDMPQLADMVFWAEWAARCQRIIEVGSALSANRIHPGSGTSRNITNLQSWVLDEWKAMGIIHGLIHDSAVRSWVRWQKLRCVFAARSLVKIRQVEASSPEFALAIYRGAKTVAGSVNWELARLAVGLLR